LAILLTLTDLSIRIFAALNFTLYRGVHWIFRGRCGVPRRLITSIEMQCYPKYLEAGRRQPISRSGGEQEEPCCRHRVEGPP